MLEHIFLEVLKMSLSASIVIVIVVLIHRLIKKFPKFISYITNTRDTILQSSYMPGLTAASQHLSFMICLKTMM